MRNSSKDHILQWISNWALWRVNRIHGTLNYRRFRYVFWEEWRACGSIYPRWVICCVSERDIVTLLSGCMDIWVDICIYMQIYLYMNVWNLFSVFCHDFLYINSGTWILFHFKFNFAKRTFHRSKIMCGQFKRHRKS